MIKDLNSQLRKCIVCRKEKYLRKFPPYVGGCRRSVKICKDCFYKKQHCLIGGEK